MKISTDLRSRLGSVRDQHGRNTCLAHAASAGHECARGEATFLSPEFLYHHARRLGGDGLEFARVSAALRADGQPLESDAPYLMMEPTSWAPPPGARVFRRDSAPISATLDAVANELASGRAPILGLTLTESFHFPSSPWIIHPSGRETGLHAVTAVASATSGPSKYILVRNSWGPSWGLHGHAWLGEDYLAPYLNCVMVLGSEV